MGTWGFGAFENDSAADVAGSIIQSLEDQLVRFRHRMRFKWAMNYEEARAAMVLLPHLVRLGVSWVPPEDATPELITEAFHEFLALPSSKFADAHRDAMNADIEKFVEVPFNAVRPLPPEYTVDGVLRRGGAAPHVCHWGHRFFADFERAWQEGDARQLVSLAAAAGLEFRWALSAFLTSAIEALEHAQTDSHGVREELRKAIVRLVSGDSHTEVEPKVAEQLRELSREDGLFGVGYVVHRLARASLSAVGASDPEQWEELATVVERDLKPYGVSCVSALRRDLGPRLFAALPMRPDPESKVTIELLRSR
jgi:hypothetical protein